jgi:hypothetical protein
VTEMSAADAAANAAATTVSFAVSREARDRVSVDEKPLAALAEPLSILEKTTIAISEIGTITVELQIIVLTCRKKLFTRLGADPLELRKAA